MSIWQPTAKQLWSASYSAIPQPRGHIRLIKRRKQPVLGFRWWRREAMDRRGRKPGGSGRYPPSRWPFEWEIPTSVWPSRIPRPTAVRQQLAMQACSATDALGVTCSSPACTGRATGSQSSCVSAERTERQRRQISFAVATTLQMKRRRRNLQKTMGATAGAPAVWIAAPSHTFYLSSVL